MAFLTGIWVSEAIQWRSKNRRLSQPYAAVLLLEIGVLLVLLLLPANTKDIIITSSIAFASSVQVQTFREVNGRNYSSTFTTGNLRTLSESAFAWLFQAHDEKSARVVRDFSIICTSFLLGTTTGGYSTQSFGNRALWCEIALLVLIAIRVQSGLRLPSIAKDAPSVVT